jgi:Trypsin-co-occurring domain 1
MLDTCFPSPAVSRSERTVPNRLVGFTTTQGPSVYVEVDTSEPGQRPVKRPDAIAEARKTFEAALNDINFAAEKALAVLRDGRLRPDGIEIQFGVRFNAEVGAVVAKAAGEGHLIVKLTWAPEPAAPTATEGATGDPAAPGA